MSLTTTTELRAFLESIQPQATSPSDAERAVAPVGSKQRLYLFNAAARLTWTPPAPEVALRYTHRFDEILRHVLGQLECAKDQLKTVPNEAERAILIQMVTSVKTIIMDRARRYDQRNNRIWNICYVWSQRSSFTQLVSSVNTSFSSLEAKIGVLPLGVPPPPMPKVLTLKKSAAASSDDAAATAASAAPTSTKPKPPHVKPGALLVSQEQLDAIKKKSASRKRSASVSFPASPIKQADGNT